MQEKVDAAQCKQIFPYGLPIVEVNYYFLLKAC